MMTKPRVGPTRILTTVLLLSQLGCAGLGHHGVAAPATARPPGSSRPNLIVVLSDDHRWDALGAAGNPSVLTPRR